MILTKKQLPVILIPAYRPDKKLVITITQLKKSCQSPIVIVDDGNEEHNEQLIFTQLLNFDDLYIVRHPYNRGKGAALKTGLNYITKYFPQTIGCITADADGQHATEDIVNIANQLSLHPHSLILGARDFTGRSIPLRSSFGNIVTAHLFHFITGTHCSDTQTGLRGIPSNEFEYAINTPGDRFEYEMNYLLGAAKRKISIISRSIQTIYINDNESSHYHPFNDSLKILKTLLAFALTSSIGTVIDLVVFFIFIHFIIGESSRSIIFATIIARLLSGAINYYLNLTYIFQSKHSYRTLFKYLLLFCLLLSTSAFSVAILPGLFGSKLLTKIVVDTILFLASYTIQQQFVFNNFELWPKEVA